MGKTTTCSMGGQVALITFLVLCLLYVQEKEGHLGYFETKMHSKLMHRVPVSESASSPSQCSCVYIWFQKHHTILIMSTTNNIPED